MWRYVLLDGVFIGYHQNVQTWAPSDGHDSVLLILDKLPRLTILNLSHNVFSENCLQYLCQALCLYLPGLKVGVSYNVRCAASTVILNSSPYLVCVVDFGYLLFPVHIEHDDFSDC